MKMTFIARKEMELNLEQILEQILKITFFCDYEELNLKAILIEILANEMDYEYNIKKFDNIDDNIDVIIKNLELYCVENNLTHQFDILRKYNY